MKKNILYIAALLITVTSFVACSKSDNKTTTPATTYASTRGVITATGGTAFTANGTSSYFFKSADTVEVKADVDSGKVGERQLLIAFENAAVGTTSFVDVSTTFSHPLANYANTAIYTREDTNTAGTIIVHEWVVKSGSYTIKSISSTAIDGTYTMNMVDVNNNGDAPITLTGAFTGNF